MNAATNAAQPAPMQHTAYPDTPDALAALVSLRLNDGDRVRLDFVNRETGRTGAIVLRREVNMQFGKLGASGFWVDVLAGGRWQYVCQVSSAEPARGWRVGQKSGKCRVSDEVAEHVRWILCELYCVPHGKEILLAQYRIRAIVRFEEQWSARDFAHDQKCREL